MKVRVTQTDIARVAGVHNTTVSLALRNSHLITEATRERIRAVALQMGYCPDPALSALVAYRNSRRQRPPAATLAYATNWSTKWGWKQMASEEKYFEGAKRKAAEHGYHLEHFWLREEGMSAARFNQMLMHRGIRGLLLAAQEGGDDELAGLDWARLTAIRIGSSPRAPALHQVTADYAGIVNLAVRQIRATGRQRTGFVIPYSWDRIADQAWSRTILGEQSQLASRERIPLLNLEPVPAANSTLAARAPQLDETQKLSRWYDQHRPEAIVCLGAGVLENLALLGIESPRDVAYVDLCLAAGSTGAGVRQNCEQLGEIAVEMLALRLEQNLSGMPDVPTITAVTGTWVAGSTLPAARSLEQTSNAGAGHLVA